MAQLDRTQLKAKFENGDIPTQADFADLIDSLALKSEISSSTGDVLTFLTSTEFANLITKITINGTVVIENINGLRATEEKPYYNTTRTVYKDIIYNFLADCGRYNPTGNINNFNNMVIEYIRLGSSITNMSFDPSRILASVQIKHNAKTSSYTYEVIGEYGESIKSVNAQFLPQTGMRDYFVCEDGDGDYIPLPNYPVTLGFEIDSGSFVNGWGCMSYYHLLQKYANTFTDAHAKATYNKIADALDRQYYTNDNGIVILPIIPSDVIDWFQRVTEQDYLNIVIGSEYYPRRMGFSDALDYESNFSADIGEYDMDFIIGNTYSLNDGEFLDINDNLESSWGCWELYN